VITVLASRAVAQRLTGHRGLHIDKTGNDIKFLKPNIYRLDNKGPISLVVLILEYVT